MRFDELTWPHYYKTSANVNYFRQFVSICKLVWGQINIDLARRHPPTHLVSPSNQPSPLVRQVVLVRLNAHPAQIQSVAIPARLNGGAGVHIPPAVVLYGMTKLVELLGLQVEELPIERSRKVSSACTMPRV